MLESFILGFWAIWSADRDMYALSESLAFIILVVILRSFMVFALPEIDAQGAAGMAVLWVYVAIVFGVVNRFASGFVATLVLAAVGGMGYYWLSENVAIFTKPFF